MKALARLTALAIAATLISGCMEIDSKIKVQKDGSGTITIKMLMSAQTAKQFAAMGNQGGAPQDPKKVFADEAKMKAAAQQFGEGVTLKSVKAIEKEDGSIGSISVFEFKDISKVTFGKMVGQPGGGGANKKQNGLEYTFKFDKGATPKLTILAKLPPKDPNAPKKEEVTDQEVQQAMMVMQMMAGLKVVQSVELDGKITKTNATYVNKDKTEVLLMSMDLDEVMKDQENLKSMIRLQNDFATAAGATIQGIKIQDPTKEVTVQFK